MAEVGWNPELTDTQRSELTDKAYRAFGSPEKAHAEGALALAYLESRGLLEWAQQYGGSVGFDPAVILSLAGKARLAGLKPKGGGQ